MNKTFNKKQIAQIALKVRQYKKLHVTTEGQMFLNPADAEEAVRVKNMIIDEPDDYVGIVEITEDQLPDAELKTFAKEPEKFGKLFENARIPRSRSEKKKTFDRKREDVTPDDVKEATSIAAALGLEAKADASTSGTQETQETQETKPEDTETKKIFPASSTALKSK